MRHRIHPVAALAAEAAPSSRAGELDRAQQRAIAGSLLRHGDDFVREVDTAITDVQARSGDELLNLVALPTAERAAQPIDSGHLDRSFPTRHVDDLVNPLVTQAEGGRDLAERPTGGMQTADGVLVGNVRLLGFALQPRRAIARLHRVTRQFAVQWHVYHGRRMNPTCQGDTILQP